MLRWVGIVGVVAGLAGCGPAIPVDEGESASTEDTPEETAEPPAPTTSTPDPVPPPPPPDPTGPVPPPDPPPADPSGVYLLAVSTPLAPDLPVQFILSLDARPGVEPWAQLIPLSLYINSRTMPREPLEPPLEATAIVEGTFVYIDLGVFVLPGEANPITGSDVEGLIFLEGQLVPEQGLLCGLAYGELAEPLAVSLEGSSFAAISIAGDGPLPETFPTGCVQ